MLGSREGSKNRVFVGVGNSEAVEVAVSAVMKSETEAYMTRECANIPESSFTSSRYEESVSQMREEK